MLERLRTRLTGSVLLWDTFLTLLALYATTRLRPHIEWGLEVSPAKAVLPWQLYVAVALIWLVVMFLLTPQRALFTRGLVEAIGRLLASVALASASFAGLLYLSFRDVSRLQFLTFVAFDLGALLVFHLIMRSYVRFRFRTSWQRRALVIGEPAAAERMAEEFARRPWTGVVVAGYASDDYDAPSAVPRLGRIVDTTQIVTQNAIDEVIFALPTSQHNRIVQLSLDLLNQPVMVHMMPGVLDLTFARTPVETVGGIPLISLRESALTEPQRVLKRIFDMGASLLLLIILSPAMLLIALLIKLESPGPIFFMQERIGEQGRHFKMVKFRSMYQDAERRWHEVARRDEDGNIVHKSSDDPRVTRVGRKLRRTSLDELPQLINVLLGQMSLVGPRPEMPYIAAEYAPWQWQRFRVPPGITGWWQVNGRSDKPMHLHTEDDLYYIQNYSFWLDLRILLKTVAVVFQGHGAY
ncbi:sugar transferase [Oscillochloris sp. ZM17-4]|uniref:sugar transferase n=1 Tax=Oscillochloris sp. ZM17-4 TaxID=2866714 RepID=UPI001C72E349|nr:sugar transferase [Oscillochloris sp. ZM17-4]MBX0330760.1 sugar transferase [Oscillochloris sp. ZM17-4]